jgi:protein SCO1/2
MNRRLLPLYLLIGALSLLAGALLARMLGGANAPALQSGTWLPEPRALSAFHLTDLAGQDFSLQSLQGHPTLLFFGFTNCPDVCPTTLATLAQVQRSAPLPGTRIVFVSIDPERDTAATLRVYLDAFSKDFIGVRGNADALAPLLKSLNAIAVRQLLPDHTYTMDHSATLYLLDSEGRLVAVFSPPFAPAGLTADLQRVRAAARI